MKLCESMEFESADGDLNANVEKNKKRFFPDNRWYCEMDCIARLYDATPPFWKIKHVLKYQLCNCGLLADCCAPGTVVNAPFEYS